MRATELAHLIVRRSLKRGDWAVDATVGNGHDTLLLADCVGPKGRVFGFDVQEDALAAAGQQVSGLPQVTLIHAGHETLSEHLPQDANDRLGAVMFNLGYLPGGNKDIVTTADTTVSALEQALARLGTGGVVTLVLYPGHPGGGQEAKAVRTYAAQLPAIFTATRYARLNAASPAPELIVIERPG